MNVSHIFLSLLRIERLKYNWLNRRMSTPTSTHLILGGTGKTGRRVARLLNDHGQTTRTAARSNTDTTFDWNDPTTYSPALSGVGRVYLVPPANSIDFAEQVAEFLDTARTAGVEHVTYLSARGIEYAPAEVALRAVELQLEAHNSFTYSILRPAWFMENFTESFLLPGILADGHVVAPTGAGDEAFISADDIAAVAVATLSDPAAHAGAAYTLTGPEALSFAETAAIIGEATGRQVSHLDLDREQWLAATVDAGVPAEYAAMLAGLFDTIRSGAGAATTTTVHDVLQREPVSFRSFARTNMDAWIAR